MAELTSEELVLLGRTELLERLEAPVLGDMASSKDCQMARAKKGETIYTPHHFHRALGVILSGRVQVSKDGFVVSVLEQGEVFGAAALFNEREEYATTLTALAPCRMVFFSQALMSRTMAQSPALAETYIRYLSGRIRFLEGKLDTLLAPSVQSKLAQYLLERREGGLVALDCPVTGLAGRLDVSRASLYRAFESLTELGAIEKSGKTVRILKEEALL